MTLNKSSTKKKAKGGTKNMKATREAAPDDRPINFGPLSSYLGYQIRQAQTAIFRDLAASTAALSVTPGEYGLLSLVDANPGISQIDLAQVYKLDKSTLSLAVSRLTKRGLVKRTRSRIDERYYTLWLLEPGHRLLQRVRAHVETQERSMDSVLRRGEREQMLDMLQRISQVLSR